MQNWSCSDLGFGLNCSKTVSCRYSVSNPWSLPLKWDQSVSYSDHHGSATPNLYKISCLLQQPRAGAKWSGVDQLTREILNKWRLTVSIRTLEMNWDKTLIPTQYNILNFSYQPSTAIWGEASCGSAAIKGRGRFVFLALLATKSLLQSRIFFQGLFQYSTCHPLQFVRS